MGVVYKQEDVNNSSLDSPTLKLSVTVGAESFLYAIEDSPHALIHLESYKHDQTFVYYYDPLDHLSDMMAGNPLLFESFSEKRIGISSAPYIIVHKSALQKHSPVQLLSSVTHLAAKDTICRQELTQLDAVCIFSIPTSLKSEVEMYFEHPNYLHTHASLIQWIAESEISNDFDRILFANLVDDTLMISAWSEGKILFENQYRTSYQEDFIYFASAVIANLKWEKDTFAISISGERKEEMMHQKVFSGYNKSNLVDSVQDGWPLQISKFLDLYAVAKCAL